LHHKFLVIGASEADITIQQRDNPSKRADGPATHPSRTPQTTLIAPARRKNRMKTKELLMSALIVALARLARAVAIRGKAQAAIKPI
jgi:hypothetical protein